MAWMNQEKKKALMPGIKKVLKKFGIKGTVKIRHHSTLVVTLREGAIDFGDKPQVNVYWIDDQWKGEAKQFLLELYKAMNACEEYQNHDRSNAMVDYFDVGWYCDISIGEWKKPYKFLEKA